MSSSVELALGIPTREEARRQRNNEINRRARERNPEAHRTRVREWQKSHPEWRRSNRLKRRMEQPITEWRMNAIGLARHRARRDGVPFDLRTSDIQCPVLCPVLGLLLNYGGGSMGHETATLDRIQPELGYIKGNVSVISNRANRLKANATLAEIEGIFRYMASIVERRE